MEYATGIIFNGIFVSKYLCIFYTFFFILYKNSAYVENVVIECIPCPPTEGRYC